MKIDTNKSGSQVGSWVKKALYGSAVLGLAMTMGATSAIAGAPATKLGFKKFTPVSRIAQMNVVRVNGQIDHAASYEKARNASVALATYVARMNESVELGNDVIKGGDWKLGGTSKKTCIDDRDSCTDEEINHAVLGIPSPDPIDPSVDYGAMITLSDGVTQIKNVKKANVLDFCNGKYASLAMGVEPIIGGDTLDETDDKFVVNGYSHAPALPCEVSIWLDDDKIYVDMLDPSAIFTLFFSDVLFSDEMKDRDFADALNAMPPQVKSEIKAIIYAALSEFDPEMKMLDKKIGPVYDSMDDIVNVVASSNYQSPYKHMSYTFQNNAKPESKNAKRLAQTIINTLSKEAEGEVPGVHPTYLAEDIDGKPVEDRVDDGDTVINLDDILSAKSSWRSARLEPISIPGGNHIIEACSPKYAKMAMGTGLDHVNALPCEITVKAVGNQLVISYLDPDFMLKSMFADISQEDKDKFGEIPRYIMTDLQNIVKAAVENHTDSEIGSTLIPSGQITFDMLPDPEED